MKQNLILINLSLVLVSCPAFADVKTDIINSDKEINNASSFEVEVSPRLNRDSVRDLPESAFQALQQKRSERLYCRGAERLSISRGVSANDLTTSFYDGTFFATAVGKTTAERKDGVHRRVVIGREDSENLFPQGVMAAGPGARFYLGRGISNFLKESTISSDKITFSMDGIKCVATIDPGRGSVARNIRGFVNEKLVYAFESKSVVRLPNSCWVSSEGEETVYNGKIILKQTHFKLVKFEDKEDISRPKITKGDVISVYVSGKEVSFNQESDTNYSYEDLEVLARKKISQDSKIEKAVGSFGEQKQEKSNRLRLIVGLITPGALIGLLGLVGKRLFLRG
jgi:hypothetical protein